MILNFLAVGELDSIHLPWWDFDASQTGYTVDQSDDGSNFSSLVTVDANINYYNHSLGEVVKKYYRVKAIDGALSSAYTTVQNATTKITPPADFILPVRVQYPVSLLRAKI